MPGIHHKGEPRHEWRIPTLRGLAPRPWANPDGVHELQVTPRAVWAWIYNESRPTPDKARALTRLSNGYLSMDDIYAEAYPKPSEAQPC